MGILLGWFKKIVDTEEFTRVAAAHAAAVRWELPRTEVMLTQRLVAMGAWRDVDGIWRLDRPGKESGEGLRA